MAEIAPRAIIGVAVDISPTTALTYKSLNFTIPSPNGENGPKWDVSEKLTD